MSLRRNVSGQFVYFTLTSVFSGNVQAGVAAAVSGRKALDGAAQALLSGSISEVGGGQYRANLFDFDTDGNCIGFLFTASGCSPVNFSVTTDGNTSGRVWLSSGQAVSLNSGQSVLVYSGQLSGQPVSLLSGQIVSLYSGQSVLVYSGQLSGQPVSLLSGRSWIASGSPVAILDKSGYALSSGGNYQAGASIVKLNMSGLEPDAAKQSILGLVLKGTAGFNGKSGMTTYCDGTTVFMTQTIITGSGMTPIAALEVGA
jgi:hypothetical protein